MDANLSDTLAILYLNTSKPFGAQTQTLSTQTGFLKPLREY